MKTISLFIVSTVAVVIVATMNTGCTDTTSRMDEMTSHTTQDSISISNQPSHTEVSSPVISERDLNQSPDPVQTTESEQHTEQNQTPSTDAGLQEHRPPYIYIQGVRYDTSLDALFLTNMGLTDDDIEPLKYMSELTDFSLSGNHISSVALLADLPLLEWLSIDCDQIRDLTPLTKLTNLEEVRLGDSAVGDVSLPGFVMVRTTMYRATLTHLDLCGYALSDTEIVPLQLMTALEDLNLNYSGSLVCDCVSDCPHILYQISDVSPLSTLTGLSRLGLCENAIQDITPLANLTNLEDLYLSSNDIRDISSLRDLKSLKNLSLSENYVTDISSLSGLRELEWLDLSSNNICDISPLAELINLKWLVLDDNKITDLSALSGLVNLEYLSLDNNKVTNWLPVAHIYEVEGRP